MGLLSLDLGVESFESLADSAKDLSIILFSLDGGDLDGLVELGKVFFDSSRDLVDVFFSGRSLEVQVGMQD